MNMTMTDNRQTNGNIESGWLGAISQISKVPQYRTVQYSAHSTIQYSTTPGENHSKREQGSTSDR